MFDTLKSRIYQGSQFIKDIENAPMREQFRGFPKFNTGEDFSACKGVCPTGALSLDPLSIDMGKCTFCGACERACKGIELTNGYKLASSSREKLVITPEIDYENYLKSAVEVREEIHKIFGRSIKFRQVSAGGCNGYEM